MKIKVTFKDPDTMHDAVVDAYAEEPCPSGVTKDEWSHIRQERAIATQCAISDKWVEYGEYIRVEFDTETGTATVIPNKG
jgi:hypothetical protein